MNRKLYAIFILIGAIGALILFYLYFFVYYTGALEIHTNTDEYTVELFSTQTAIKKSYDCPENPCVIADISPVDHTITLRKEGYKNNVLAHSIIPRVTERLDFALEKQATLNVFIEEESELSTDQIIQAKRDEKRFYVYFSLRDDAKITFLEGESELIVSYNSGDELFELGRSPIVSRENIFAEYIGESEDIFLKIGKSAYIVTDSLQELHKLPLKIDINYIKKVSSKEYMLVTDVGTYVYQFGGNPDYQYLFRDYIVLDSGEFIGVIYEDEKQKKQNFNLDESRNLIILYDSTSKERIVLLSTNKKIERIERVEEGIIITTNEGKFLLENYK